MAFELLRAIWHAIEHLVVAIKEVHGAQDKIEFVPMFFDPFSAGRRVDGIVIELDASADSQIGISLPQTIDFIKIDSGVVTIVIGEGDVRQRELTRRIRPGLKQFRCVSLHPMSLRMSVVIGKELEFGVGVLERIQSLSTIPATPLQPLSRHSQELLPNTQLRKLRKKDLGDKDLVWRQLARCDCFVILDPLLRVN